LMICLCIIRASHGIHEPRASPGDHVRCLRRVTLIRLCVLAVPAGLVVYHEEYIFSSMAGRATRWFV
jgi:hypothetical protein